MSKKNIRPTLGDKIAAANRTALDDLIRKHYLKQEIERMKEELSGISLRMRLKKYTEIENEVSPEEHRERLRKLIRRED